MCLNALEAFSAPIFMRKLVKPFYDPSNPRLGAFFTFQGSSFYTPTGRTHVRKKNTRHEIQTIGLLSLIHQPYKYIYIYTDIIKQVRGVLPYSRMAVPKGWAWKDEKCKAAKRLGYEDG